MERVVTIEPTLHKSHGPCPHCSGDMQSVWGWVHLGRGTRAIYYVRWTAGHPEHGMTWMVCVGRWDDLGVAVERRSVGLATRIANGRPQFMVIDAANTPWGCDHNPVLGARLSREDVVNTALATEVFAYVDQVLIEDPRVARFVETGEGMDGHGTAPASSRSTSWTRHFRPGN